MSATSPRWLAHHALRVAGVLALGFALAWLLGDALWLLPGLQFVGQWIPTRTIGEVVYLTTLLTAVLYVVREGTAG